MTFQYFFFDTYSGYFILALPIAVIIAAVYGIIRFRKDKSTPFLRKVFSCLFVCYMVGLLELVLLLDVLRVLDDTDRMKSVSKDTQRMYQLSTISRYEIKG